MATRGIKIYTTIDGIDEIMAALRKVGAKADELLDEAVLAGAEPIRAEAERRAPRLTGAGAQSIEVKLEDKGTGRARAVIGPDVARPRGVHGGQKHFYMLIQEFGAKSHPIKPKSKVKWFIKGLVGQKWAKEAIAFDDTVVAKANHPGIPARPFMRPALDSKHDEGEEAAAEVLRRGLGL